MCTVHCVVYTVYCVLCTLYCMVHTACCVFYRVYCILCNEYMVYSIMYCIWVEYFVMFTIIAETLRAVEPSVLCATTLSHNSAGRAPHQRADLSVASAW